METQFVERGKAQSGKIQTKNEFELCYLRHQYFRKAHYNPNQEEMKPYLKIASNLAKNTFFTYKRLFHIVGMESEDVVNVANVHIVSFIGLFTLEHNADKLDFFQKVFMDSQGKEPTNEEILCKNQAHFTIFLKQRMQDLVRVCRQKAKNIKGLKVDSHSYFCGENEPPKNLEELIKNYEKLGYKKIDVAVYKAVKKKHKQKEMDFKIGKLYYLTVSLRTKNITLTDFSGADLDPRENSHNISPDRVFSNKEEDVVWEKRKNIFQSMNRHVKANVLKNFIEKNKLNDRFTEELKYASVLLRRLEK